MNEQWQELKETIVELRDNDGTGTQQEVCKFLANLMDVLENQMSSSENQNKWIPVSERLPKNFQRVLVTIVNYAGNYVVRVAEYHNSRDKCAFQVKENREWWEVGEKGLLAWAPLPQPYKAESEE